MKHIKWLRLLLIFNFFINNLWYVHFITTLHSVGLGTWYFKVINPFNTFNIYSLVLDLTVIWPRAEHCSALMVPILVCSCLDSLGTYICQSKATNFQWFPSLVHTHHKTCAKNFLGLLKFYAKHLNLIKERSIGKIYVNFGNNNSDTHDKR